MTKNTSIKYHIRWMIRRDMPEVLDIERSCFEFMWRADEFVKVLRDRSCIGMVAEYGSSQQIAGFMIYELHRSRLHVLNFAVHPHFQRMGVGKSMVDKLKGKLSAQRRTRITLEIRETNLAAQLFFRDMGFVATSVVQMFYDDTEEDAIFFTYQHEER